MTTTPGLTIAGIPYTGPSQQISSAAVNVPTYNYGVAATQLSTTTNSGLFRGTLSAHGNLIAMSINMGNYYIDSSVGLGVYIPYLTGYLREYWRDPTKMDLGADSAIPAITSVIPASFKNFSGNLIYYIDLQLTRLTGSNFFDNFTFLNVLNQALNWVTTSNNYLVGLKNSETKNLEYYGSQNYQEFLTQGFSKYKDSIALKTALKNLGKIITEINEGYFGTSNSIASIMLKSGLGTVGNLTAKLNSANINVSNIYNESYTQQISQILSTITNPSDLNLIQQVLKTTVSNLSSPLDYTNLQKVSGLQNDSVFQSLKDFGKDIKGRTPFLTVETGKDLVAIIDNVLSEITDNVSNLNKDGGLLPQSIIDQLRNFLPISPDNGPINILNVIGMSSGYLTNDFKIVNENLLAIEQSSYGIQIHNALIDIGNSWKSYQGARQTSADNVTVTPFVSETEFNNKVAAYKTLLATVAEDPNFKSTVETLNAAYNRICEATYIEVTNFNRANFTTEIFRENTQIYSFVDSLPSYAADTQDIAIDTLLYNMCQPNEAGDIAKSILNQYKNNLSLGNIGVKITGTV